ncbi:hypothetical protein [Chengkuizengella sediminis]|uniref:hypothetical protein n=1 Tax=Chengkuizengella sediminis TaxID=1885917 RepID=UPI001389D4EA|nr:hypothetical protein [Chengkuizengella sediminis]NDI36636.1 hypothetical protein [Chengkuizengella sediminis]
MKIFFIILIVIIALVGCSDNSKEEGHSGITEGKNEDIEMDKEKKLETITQYEESAQFVYELLKTGQFNADYLEEQTVPPENINLTLEEIDILADTILTNMQEDMDWYNSEINKLEVGEKLPYDPRFGVTEDEYNLVMDMSEQIELVKTREGQLKIKKVDGKIAIVGKDTGNVLTKVGIDLVNNKILTEFGTAKYDRKIEANENQILTGMWNGHCWKIEESTHDFQYIFTDLNICIGKLVETGETLIYNHAGVVDDTGAVIESSEIIKFEGNQK